MGLTGHRGTLLQFSTRGLAPVKRLPALRELFAQSIQMDIDAAPGVAVEMEMQVLPALRRARMVSSFTARVTRSAERVRDGEDTVCLMMKTGGHMALAQGHRESVPRDGDAVLLVYRQPAVLHFADATYLSVRVPFSAVSALADVESAAARCVLRETEALRLLRAYVGSLPAGLDDPQVCRLAAAHVHDLLALAIGATAEGRELAQRRTVRAARLRAIEADLLNDATLGIEQVAGRHRISTRYVQMLFEDKGTTFSEHVLERRLDTAFRMLTSPRCAGWKIASIALEAGFSDLSHFNRRFKRRYEMTPGELRAHAFAASVQGVAA